MGLFKDDPPPPPDMKPYANAIMATAKMNDDRAQEQFAFFKDQALKDRVVSDRMLARFEDISDFNLTNAKEDRQRWEDVFRPQEDDFIEEAKNYDTPERRATEIGRVQADAAQKSDQAREASLRQLEGYGINPGATRYAGLDRGARMQLAATQAALSNETSRAVEDTGRNLKLAAINIGRGLPAQSGAQFGTAMSGASGGLNSELATTGSAASTTGTAPAYAGMATSGYAGAANVVNAGYQNDLAAFKAQQAQSSGIGKLVGAGAGMFLGPMAGAAGEMAADKIFAAKGGAIPRSASPSRGVVEDDVPAQLTAGEFVIPADVVRWYGEDKLHKMVDKAHQDRHGHGIDASKKPPRHPSTQPARGI